MFFDGVFECGDDGLRLLASRCRSCEKIFYPRVELCLDCHSIRLEHVRLDGKGRLECFTTVHMSSFRARAPYTVGYVRVPEGLRVFAPIECHGVELRVGMPMRLSRHQIGEDAEVALAYCFVPD